MSRPLSLLQKSPRIRPIKGGSGSGGSGAGGGEAGGGEAAGSVLPQPALEAVNYDAADIRAWDAALDNQQVNDARRAERLGTATAEQLKISDNHYIATAIKEEAAANPRNFRGVRDSSGNLQAAAIVKTRRDSLYIDYLATAPWNARTGDSRAMRGAGRELMTSLAREAVAKNKPLTLASLPGAQGFYERMGFEQTKPARGRSLATYRMDVSKAQEFLNQVGG